ncbi:Na+/H+ antiporter NhaA [Nocardioides sp. Soil805]|uniref:Na+/H+ antiporter NhaA n=1 Tax=Nocardioides sp. Soil805 TaxID=1736416 RepID=UPI0007034F0A|nr:Na+/H+ antiporter NhaA [Nocardioides sp. Soil805]KRF37306.1 sodium:proton antiporter [Nocardioides sp. Soil805]
MPIDPHGPRDVSEDEVWATGPSYLASNKPLARLVARPVREFLRVEAAGSILLLLAAAAALIWANSPWASSYDEFWHSTISIDLGAFRIEESLQHWVNDALMVIFFFVVGLEIKYEIVSGDLRDPKTAALPIVAAIGGMLVPAGLYLLIAGGGDGADGWGIPMATDIAFAVGVLGLLGTRIPSAARLFLLTLAIVDDIGAIIVIAAFYTEELHLEWLALALVLLGVMVALRMLRVWSLWVYVVLGFFVWFALLESGVHATLAGVAIGLITPARALLKEDVARSYAQRALADRHLDPDELSRLRFLLGESVPVVERLQTALHPLSSYVVLPVFALANAGVPLGGGALGDALTSAVGLGIGVGLVVGKPVGILLACFIAVRLGLGRLPEDTTWAMVLGLGAVAGIGFTVSIFIAGLSFPGSDLLTGEAKVGILVASLVAAVVGTVLLLLTTRGRGPDAEDSQVEVEAEG